MLQRNRNAFAPHPIAPPPPTLGVKHTIHLTDTNPVKQAPYRQSPQKQQFIQTNVELLESQNLIRKSNSPWSSPIVIVPKHTGELRMCIDYRKLNAQTKKDAYPMPLIEDCLHLCRDAKYLSIIDVQDAYYHILLDQDSRACTAFCTNSGLYEWLVMPFGLCNAPATFQRHVDSILREHVGKTCAAFFDDIVVYTKGSFEQHLLDLEEILKKLATAKLSAKVKKCKFGYNEIIFVGHLVKDGKIMPDPAKLDAVKLHAPPTDLTQLKSFLSDL